MTKQMWQVEIYNSIKSLGAATVSQITENIALPSDWVRPNVEILESNGAVIKDGDKYQIAK